MSFKLETARTSESVPLVVLLFGGALSLFTWVSPNHYAPWMSFHSELSMAMCGFLVGSWILWRTRNETSQIPWLAVATAAFAAIPFVQLVFGLAAFFGDAWLVTLYAAGFAIAQTVGYRASRKWGIATVIEPYAWIILLGSMLSVFIQLYQWQDLGYLEWAIISIAAVKRPFGNLTQPNQLATLLCMGLLAVAILFDRKRLSVWTTTALIALFGFGVAMSQSRAGLLEVAAAAAMLCGRRPRLTGRLKAFHVIAGAVVVAAMVPSWSAVKTASPLSEVGRPTADMATHGSRPIHWASMVDAIGRKPGQGYGSYGVSQAQYIVAPDHPSSRETIAHSHNLILDLMVWDGVPIGLLATLALGGWFCAVFLRVPDSQSLLALGSVVVVFVHAMVEFPLYYTYFLLPTGVLMGSVSAVAIPRAAVRVSRWVVPVASAAACLATVLTVIDYFHLEADVARSAMAHAHVGNKWTDRDYTHLRVLTHFNHFWEFAIEPERRGMTSAQLDEMRDVVLRFPSDADIIRYAAALALNGRPMEAHSALSRICKTGPVDACRSAESLWAALGKRDAEIKAVAWPVTSD